jgi:S1-C subfamily serine protease
LWINLGDKGFDVVKITENGPAAQAGLTVGDRIVAIGDDAAAVLSLSDARRIFRMMPVGKAVSIAYWRGGEARKAILLPRDQIPEAVSQR